MERTSVAVVMGGESGEREISMISGSAIADALDRTRFEVRPVVIRREGRWRVGRRALGEEEEFAAEGFPFEEASPSAAVERLAGLGTSVAFLALHGPRGEDGVVQGLLELHRLPYTGSGVAASALAMDKTLARVVLRAAGIPVPEGFDETGPRYRAKRAEILERAASAVGFPCYVKPASEGSSLGVRRVERAGDLPAAIEGALSFGARFVVERAIEGPEATCGVLGNSLDESLLPLPVVEIVPKRDGFFTMREKYDPAGAEETCPPRTIPLTVQALVREQATAAHRALRCDGMSRVDFRISPEGLPFVLEVNTIPGFTPRSLLPKAAAVAGINFVELCARLVDAALRRFAAEPARARRV
ncbi:MAG TPA: D-alanine--D-alanine ligase [Planctomycetota bacterium]|jgi:D-alanine-D-alanine ligase|nr:D-alanine--D-alanine ligase [Planctomycetota bacterium]